MKPYSICMRDARHHGIVVGVSLPGAPDPVPDDVLERLLPEERDHARTLRGYRQVEWVGGRLAAHQAMETLGEPVVPVLSDARGAPRLAAAADRVALSLAHKRDLAVALVARSRNGWLGLDLEDMEPARMRVAERVLTAAELQRVQALPEDRRWTAVVVRFSLKEAIYKALAPTLERYIDFSEAEVHPLPDGTASVRLELAQGEPSPHLDARFAWLPGRVLSTVRASWA